MKKVMKEYIEWHSAKDKHPISNNPVLIQCIDGILPACWDKQKQRWCAFDNGCAWGRTLNEDVHVYYWAYYPKGIEI